MPIIVLMKASVGLSNTEIVEESMIPRIDFLYWLCVPYKMWIKTKASARYDKVVYDMTWYHLYMTYFLIHDAYWNGK